MSTRMEQGNTKTENITTDLIDWLLYDLPYLHELCEEIMPHDFADIIEFHKKTKTMIRSKIEIVACKRATLTSVLDAVDKAIRHLPGPEFRSLYRMKYRAGKSVREIAKETHFHYNTIQEKIVQLRCLIAASLLVVPGSHVREFLLQRWTEQD